MNQGSRKLSLNPFRFGFGICMGIIGMEFTATSLFRIVLHRYCWIFPQIISKRQVPVDFAASRFKAVKLEFPLASGWLVERAIPPAGNPILAPISVTKLCEHRF